MGFIDIRPIFVHMAEADVEARQGPNTFPGSLLHGGGFALEQITASSLPAVLDLQDPTSRHIDGRRLLQGKLPVSSLST